ncbi:ATP synthase subunit b, mitochondrial-like [Belonocnema kinseyi]|uniref:ATP synthase subunit b, mitochondrial-like n=1 Tax=Belonocnema kinseyi TaxID=2817044 RepID=UPI00143D03AF|nr:ATP synthase subunit b, mitochondrial-like [Belonocnema kinseyi]
MVVNCFSGPYMFGLGVSTYLLSKEIYILEHEYYSGCSLFLVLCGGYYKFKPQISAFLDKAITDYEESWNTGRTQEIKANEELIENLKKEQWRTDAQKMILDVKKENIKMQLEAAYRERVARVYSEKCSQLEI